MNSFGNFQKRLLLLLLSHFQLRVRNYCFSSGTSGERVVLLVDLWRHPLVVRGTSVIQSVGVGGFTRIKYLLSKLSIFHAG